jgi:hypothetical protein
LFYQFEALVISFYNLIWEICNRHAFYAGQ